MPVIRAILNLRNDNMISARERLGFSQKDVADRAGVYQGLVSQMERMDFDFAHTWDRVLDVAEVLEIDPFDIMPEGMARKIVPSKFIRRMSFDTVMLDDLRHSYRDKFILPCPSDEAERKEFAEIVDGFKSELSYREREIIRLRDEGHTWEQIGMAFKVTRERVRQVYLKGMRQLQLRAEYFAGEQKEKEAAIHNRTTKEREWEKATK